MSCLQLHDPRAFSGARPALRWVPTFPTSSDGRRRVAEHGGKTYILIFSLSESKKTYAVLLYPGRVSVFSPLGATRWRRQRNITPVLCWAESLILSPLEQLAQAR